MNWRRFDTLFVRLFLLMWATLVLAHLAAFSVVSPTLRGGPGGGGADPSDVWSWGEMEESPGPASPRKPGVGLPAPRRPAGPGDSPSAPPPADAPGPGPAGSPDGLGGPPIGARAGPGSADGLRLPILTALPPASLPAQALWLDYGLRFLIIGIGAAIGARWLTGPVRRLAQAAGELTHRGNATAPPRLDAARGTAEVREAARVFNDMAARLQQQFDARGMHLAAVSHDLRTPLTRLRLRLEALPGGLRESAARDVHDIDELIAGTLAVLREQHEGGPAPWMDVSSLLEALVDDLAEQGPVVALDAVPGVRVKAHPAALRRIVGNLVDNALRHGGGAGVRVRVTTDGDGVALVVDDDGPGIAPDALDRVFEPWVRLPAERGAAALPGPSGSHGLGLAIARDLAERDGGTLTLQNRTEGGLRARLWIPGETCVSVST